MSPPHEVRKRLSGLVKACPVIDISTMSPLSDVPLILNYLGRLECNNAFPRSLFRNYCVPQQRQSQVFPISPYGLSFSLCPSPLCVLRVAEGRAVAHA
jgi:hypothetical protein